MIVIVMIEHEKIVKIDALKSICARHEPLCQQQQQQRLHP
jgi:hypothetical protein